MCVSDFFTTATLCELCVDDTFLWSFLLSVKKKWGYGGGGQSGWGIWVKFWVILLIIVGS